jgi:hypothetical protein
VNSESGHNIKMKIVEMTEVTPASSPRISKTPYSLLVWVTIYLESYNLLTRTKEP